MAEAILLPPETILVWGAQTEEKYIVPGISKTGTQQFSKTLLRFAEGIFAKMIKKPEFEDQMLKHWYYSLPRERKKI